MKKGFTLIELLATVIILTIIFLFATPKIIGIINDAKATNIEIIENKIIDAAREYVNEYDKDYLQNFINIGDVGYITVTELIDCGLIDDKEVNNLDSIPSVKLELLANDIVEYSIYYP